MTVTFIHNKTKNAVKHLLVLCLCFSCLSCEKIIYKPIDEYNTLETEEAVVELLNGAYIMLADAVKMYNHISVKSDDINLQNQSEAAILREDPTNFYYGFSNYQDLDFKGEWIFKAYYLYPTYSDVTTEFYRSMYRSVLLSNKIIHYLSDIEKRDKWPGYLGEAHFLRAYLYFKLARTFGRIPLVTDIYVNYELPLASFANIYAQIENDLIKAVSFLPEGKNSSRKGAQTPHRGTASAMLAEVYLTMGGYPINDPAYYVKAAETAREVIENADVYGFGLVDDFANLWQWKHHKNAEAVWSMYYQGEDYNPQYKKFVTSSALMLKERIDKVSTEKAFFRSFPNNYRKEMSFWHSGFVEMIPTDNVLSGTDQRNLLIFEDATYSNVRNFFYGNVVGKKQSVNFSCYSDGMINTSYPPYKIILKRAQYASSGNLDFGTGLDSTMAGIYDNLYNIEHNPEFEAAYVQFFHIVRYAHTLLTYAEASARSGNPDFLAYEALNKVRRRAYKLPINTPSVYDLPSGLSAIAFADSVVKERGWEFCHEFEGRWNDILRLQLYPQIEADRVNEFQSGLVDRTYNGQTYFLPIPQTDIWLNPYLESNDSE